jgi:hypothetical protein
MNIEDHPTVMRMRAIADAPFSTLLTRRMFLSTTPVDRAHAAPAASSCSQARWRMPVEDSLTQGEKARGYVLACQALAESDVVVES